MSSVRQQAKPSGPIRIRVGRAMLAAALLSGVLVATETTTAPPTVSAMGTIHVDASASSGGDGTTWALAFDDLQDALAVAVTGDDVWIAEGTYYPTSGSDRSIGFEIPDGVSLYGSFESGDTFGDRDPVTKRTILSGDLGVAGVTADNTYQVVKIVDQQNPPDPITIDGLEIRHGRADGDVGEQTGAALYIVNGQGVNTFRQVTIAENEGTGQGGIVSSRFPGATFVMVDSTVTDNGDPLDANPDIDGGGAAMSFASVAVTMTNVDIVDNRQGSVESLGATALFLMSNSRVTGNIGVGLRIGGLGGTIANTTIIGNDVAPGAALYIRASQSVDAVVHLVNTVIANHQDPSAPGIKGPGITLEGHFFNGQNGYAHLVADNLTLAQNGFGTGFACDDFADSLTIPDSSANRVGGLPGGDLLVSATFDNSILWDTSGCGSLPVRTPDASVITWRNSIVRASGGSGAGWNTDVGVDGGGNIEADPLFIDDDDCLCTTTDYRLRSGSPAFNIGDNSLLPLDTVDLDNDNNTAELLPVDLNSDERITDGTVDAGAYEGLTCLSTQNRLYVNAGSSAQGQGTDWSDAFAELRDALAFAPMCDNLEEMWVGIGTYTPTAGTDRTASFEIPEGVSIYGGFASGQTELSQRLVDPFVMQSVLSGEIGGPSNADNSYHVVRVTQAALNTRLDGFRVVDGNANHSTVPVHQRGGGVQVDEGEGVVLANLIVHDNEAQIGAGVALVGPGTTLVSNVTIRDNEADDGGGLLIEEADATVVNSVIHDNIAGTGVGGVLLVDTTSTLVGVTVADNQGGAVDGLLASSSSGAMIKNSIVWGNSVGAIGAGPIWNNSDVEGSSVSFPGTDAGGNIDADPLFDFTFHASAGSPVLGAGSNTDAAIDVADVDDDGDVAEATPDRSHNTRIVGGAVDMGAFEGVDSDGDGVSDGDDNCPNVSNSGQSNSDDDGLGDACDPDDDNDLILDGVDNCRVDANPGQENFDGDSQGDVCDPDDDNDGLPDNIDNCSLNSDPDQTDRDHDGLGNVCDPDDDDDGVLDGADNCQFHVNPDQEDSDGDGIGDVCDAVVPELIDPLVPARILDTRTGPGIETTDGLFEGEGQRAAGSTLELTVAGRGGVDVDADAAVLNITAVAPVADGFITVFPCGTDRPTASSLNYVAGENVPNLVIAKIGDGGKVCIYTREATHLLADVSGSAPSDTTYQSLDPVRLLDTRAAGETIDGQFAGDGLTVAGGVVELVVAGRDDVAADAEAVVLNVTSVGSTVAGFVTVYACGLPRPNASNLNHRVGVNRPNLVVAPIGDDGKVCIFTSGVTHLLADVGGAFGPGSGYAVLEPARLVDTRATGETIDALFEGDGVRPAASTLTVQVGGRAGVAVDAEAAVLNVSVVAALGAGFATVYPCDEARPTASNLNFTAGLTAPNLVLAKLSAAGTVCVFTSASTHLLVDVSGTV